MDNSVNPIFGQNFTQNITKVCFKQNQNLLQDIPGYPGNQKNKARRKKPKAITVLKKRGGGESSKV